MPTITITLTIPEGVTVSVAREAPIREYGVGATTSSAPLVAVNACPEHNLPWKHVPAGVSKKTGKAKAYSAFWACSEMGCNRRPAIGWKPPVAAAVDAPPNDEYDWGLDDPA